MALILTCVIGTTPWVTAEDFSFEKNIRPIFEQKCVRCHNPSEAEGGLDLTSAEGLLKGSENGKVILFDQLDDSQLLQQVISKSMPPKGAQPLTPKEIDTIQTWLDSGATFNKAIAPSKVTQERIIPLIHLRCVKCHGPSKQEAGLDLRTVESMKKGGKSGPAMVAGNSQASLAVQKIRAEQMPPRKRIVPDSVKTMTPSELEILCNWIDQGMPSAPKQPYQVHTSKADRNFWSFKTPKKAIASPVQNPSRVNNAIDSFVLAQLETRGLGFNQSATREVMIRRLYLDLLGLPPGSEVIRSFLEDKREDAYERLVDRVLLSPEFGEKWASHWLDSAGYADSEGGQ
ncbi:MAG: c-type cytochrome domain-containing protein, partial [Planctomycetota bacterium]|nr:c-type cytochrome domain-containing protein [Planctomycetota bacterium]